MAFIKTIKIRGYHCDSYGHLNNARYLELFEEARWSLLEEANIIQPLKERGLLFFIVNINVNYRRAVDDGFTIEIHTQTDEIKRKTISFKQTMYEKGSDTVLSDAIVTFVLFDPDQGKAITIDPELQELFATNG